MRKQETVKKIILIATTLSAFLTPFLGSAVNIALPAIGKEFGMNAVQLGWVATAYLLSSAIFLVIFGRLADIYGRKMVYLYGITIFSLASFFAVYTVSPETFILTRVLQGIGSAMIFGTGIAILTAIYPQQERGKVLGINVASVYLGLSLGPFLGGIMTQYWGWRSIFLANVPLGALIIMLVDTKLEEEWKEAAGEKFDFLGSLVYAGSLFALIYGFSHLPTTNGLFLTGSGLVGLIGFVVLEFKRKYPVLDIKLFRHNLGFSMSNLAALINYSATFATGFLLSLYLQNIKGFSPERSGLILLAQPVLQAVFSPLTGKLSDRIEPRVIASAGMGLTTLGLAFLIFLEKETPAFYVVISLVLIGIGLAFFSSPNTNAVMSSVEKKFYGVASGILGTMRLMGQMLSMGLTMLIINLIMGKVAITPEYFGQFLKSLHWAFAIFTGCCFAGIFASLARGKVRQHSEISAE